MGIVTQNLWSGQPISCLIEADVTKWSPCPILPERWSARLKAIDQRLNNSLNLNKVSLEECNLELTATEDKVFPSVRKLQGYQELK